MGREVVVVVVALGVEGVVAASSRPVAGPVALPAVVAVAVELRRALVVLVVL